MDAAVAQSVEQRIRNAKVTSSIPVSGTNLIQELPEKPRLRLFCCLSGAIGLYKNAADRFRVDGRGAHLVESSQDYSRVRPMKHKSGGFTLIELMVAVVVIAILSAIAIPQYNDYVTRSRIPMATSTLADMSVRMEQHFQDNRVYTGACNKPSDPPSVAPKPVDNAYFDFSCDDNPPTATTCEVKATGQGAMTGFVFRIRQNGRDTTAVPAGWAGANAGCWVTSRGGC